MRFYLILLCLFNLLIINAKGQSNDLGFNINDYKHTIVSSDHKTVFQLKPVKGLSFSDPNKKYYWYSNNQIKITQGGFSGKLLNGYYNDFYPSNNLKESGVFIEGLKDGEWKTWSENGTLVERFTYKKGILNGRFYKYNEGTLFQEGFYKNGNLNGLLKVYVKVDSITKIKYQNGLVKTQRSNLFNFFSKIFK